MRLGFFHDSKLVIAPDRTVYSIAFPYKVWERYLDTFDAIQVCTRMVPGEGSGREVSSGDRVTFAPTGTWHSSRRKLSSVLAFFGTTRNIRNALMGIDCAVARLPGVNGWIAVALAGRMKIPVLIELVGCPFDAYWNHSVLGKFVAPFAFLLTRHQIRRAKYVLYVTRHFLQKRYPTTGRSLACSDVVIARPASEVLEDRLRHIDEVRAEDPRPLVLATTAGVDVRYKGHRYVLRAMRRLARSDLRLQYWLIGGGDPADLRSLATKLGLGSQVHFLGPQPHDSVLNILKNVDLYVQPSLQEGLPRAVMEAMSVGCPVIASRIGGVPELLGEDAIFKPRRVSELAQLLDATSPGKLKSMAIRNFAVIHDEYDSDMLASKRSDFLSEFRRFADLRELGGV